MCLWDTLTDCRNSGPGFVVDPSLPRQVRTLSQSQLISSSVGVRSSLRPLESKTGCHGSTRCCYSDRNPRMLRGWPISIHLGITCFCLFCFLSGPVIQIICILVSMVMRWHSSPSTRGLRGWMWAEKWASSQGTSRCCSWLFHCRIHFGAWWSSMGWYWSAGFGLGLRCV